MGQSPDLRTFSKSEIMVDVKKEAKKALLRQIRQSAINLFQSFASAGTSVANS
jgi:hypothetical protein